MTRSAAEDQGAHLVYRPAVSVCTWFSSFEDKDAWSPPLLTELVDESQEVADHGDRMQGCVPLAVDDFLAPFAALFTPTEDTPMTITADTITDSMIQNLAARAATPDVRRLCKVALNDGATYLRADVIKAARARCAEILNDQQHPVRVAAHQEQLARGVLAALDGRAITRSQTEPASDDEPRVTIALPEGAASVLQIDEPRIWRNVETVKVKRAGRGRSYVIELPVHDAELMLKDCIVYGNTSMSGGEGADIDTSGKYGCRRAAERLALALNQVAPRWERG